MTINLVQEFDLQVKYWENIRNCRMENDELMRPYLPPEITQDVTIAIPGEVHGRVLRNLMILEMSLNSPAPVQRGAMVIQQYVGRHCITFIPEGENNE